MHKFIIETYSKLPPAKWRRLPPKYRLPLAVTSLFLIAVFFLVSILFFLYERSDAPAPFPISVDPKERQIAEDPNIYQYYRVHIEDPDADSIRLDWIGWLVDKLFESQLYQLLAAPRARTIVVYPGERHEEVADEFGDILRWSDEERAKFVELVASSSPELIEGKFYPGKYLADQDADPETIATAVTQRFNREILARYNYRVSNRVSLEDALTIASLLEREAYDFSDMRIISGVIWNRLFEGMPLQLDATLQYAKGSLPYGPWWPVPLPKDKYIDSPYNTYQNEGLPPTPIGNPSLEAILAALNPAETDCLFYFHAAGGDFYCSETYEGHVANLKKLYGRGR